MITAEEAKQICVQARIPPALEARVNDTIHEAAARSERVAYLYDVSSVHLDLLVKKLRNNGFDAGIFNDRNNTCIRISW